jgi:hypothetical protein
MGKLEEPQLTKHTVEKPGTGGEKSDKRVLACPSDFGGLVVSMLASGTQDRGFAPGRSSRIFSGEKIFTMPSFGREVRPFAPCQRTL